MNSELLRPNTEQQPHMMRDRMIGHTVVEKAAAIPIKVTQPDTDPTPIIVNSTNRDTWDIRTSSGNHAKTNVDFDEVADLNEKAEQARKAKRKAREIAALEDTNPNMPVVKPGPDWVNELPYGLDRPHQDR